MRLASFVPFFEISRGLIAFRFLKARLAFLPSRRMGAAAILCLAATVEAQSDSGYWTIPGGGSWANANNWDSGIIADGEDNTAYFGISTFATIPATATFTLDGARSIGDVEFFAQNGPDQWFLNTGSGGLLTLDKTFNPPPINVSAPDLTVTVNAVLAGSAGMEKFGDGTLILKATNSYTGETTVNGGTLLVNGMVGDVVTVAAGTLGGTGVISGPVTVAAGGRLAPGMPPGILTMSNSLTLQTGSTTFMIINATTQDQVTLAGLTTVNYGGTLVISNLSGSPVLERSFQLVSAAGAQGNFNSLVPQLTGGLRWRFDPASGVLAVVSTASIPRIASATNSGANLVLQIVNGAPGQTSYLLAATDLNLPLANWTRVATNVVDVGGRFSVSTTLNPGITCQFFTVSTSISP